MELHIKNMVCQRCVQAVRELLHNEGVSVSQISLGLVAIGQKLSESKLKTIAEKLEKLGFELLNDRQAALINQIKSILIRYIHHEDEAESLSIPNLLASEIPHDYAFLSRLFSSVEGQTIEHFVINQKIEKAKELMTYNELTISEIAFRLHYSSPAHLSAQFKKVTGMSPSTFKTLQNKKRKPLDAF